MRTLKKIFILLITTVCILSLGACSKEKEETPPPLNYQRGTNYKFDFVNYITATAYGANGQGVLDIRPKDFSVDDFETEEDYILMRKTIDSLCLYIVPGKEQTSYLQATKTTDLSNGDIVTISIKDTYSGKGYGADINLEPFSFEISGLTDGIEINLFDESSVQFYGLSGTTEVYPYIKKGGNVPSEIMDNIEYSIKADSTQLTAGKTILTISAQLNSDFLNSGDDPYYTTDIYMKRHDYVAADQTEKVLMTVLDPIDFTKVKQDDVAGALYQALENEQIKKNGKEYKLDSIATLQQLKSSQGAFDAYGYTVTALASNEEEASQICIRSTVRMVKLDNTILVISNSHPENVQDDFCYSAYDSHNMIINYTAQYAQEPTEETNE